jgi:acyl dehydratase
MCAMSLSSAVVGKRTRRFRHDVDARWLMAYAAALGERAPIYFDTTGALAAHPMFPVCIEWPVVLDGRNIEGSQTLTMEERGRGVHATHDLVLHRPLGAGELFTTGSVIGVEQRPPGAYQMTRLDTVDTTGAPVCSTYQGGLMRGVPVSGGDRWSERAPALPAHEDAAPDDTVYALEVAAGLAHTYTECARIWNPIHTDRAIALRAGLPDIILHGTATLALAVSALVNRQLNGDPRRVRRIACRFAAMVLIPTTLSLRVAARAADGLWFEVTTPDGGLALRDGYLGFDAR